LEIVEDKVAKKVQDSVSGVNLRHGLMLAEAEADFPDAATIQAAGEIRLSKV
jgi:hypothetical protein